MKASHNELVIIYLNGFARVLGRTTPQRNECGSSKFNCSKFNHNLYFSGPKQNNAMLIEVNPENTEMSSEMDLVIRNTSATALPEFVSMFREN